ncbi:archease [Halorubellus sp. JP-L1]|uniref:archease n=1 Tax=Halorubellus sp. JP-L1 TaxID=2715753 RepID=UPI00140A4FD7|nr:archease [Halorubellus sp. JP-L1]NHN40618.1 archease [Halorubellus sp. JP-L1]
MTGSFSLREHTADVAVEATGSSPSAVFGAVGDGLAAAMCDDIPEAGGETFEVEIEAESLDGLLYDYLGRLIYERDVRLVLPVDNDATVTVPDGEAGCSDADDDEAGGSNADDDEAGGSDADGGDGETGAYRVSASARGVPLADVDAREVKAVTYSEIVVEERDGEWYAYVVFDV